MATTIRDLSVREPGRSAGGLVVDAHFGQRADTLAGRGAALLLIHGYNNSQGAATKSFESFVVDLESAIGRSPLPWPVFGVQWPGDEANPIASAASYPFKIAVAREAAERLVAYLSSAFGPGGVPILLSIVAHSLGCRLAVDLLNLLCSHPEQFNVAIDRVALMAAAVPINHVAMQGDLRLGAQLPRRTLVLHSTGDRVLHFAFPVGQTAGFDGFFPTAVGRLGGPGSTWVDAQPMAHGQDLYDHSSYWPGSESAAAVAALLNGAPASTIAVRGMSSHALPSPNAIASRAI